MAMDVSVMGAALRRLYPADMVKRLARESR